MRRTIGRQRCPKLHRLEKDERGFYCSSKSFSQSFANLSNAERRTGGSMGCTVAGNKPRYTFPRVLARPSCPPNSGGFSRAHAPLHFRLDVPVAGAELRSSETRGLAERDGRLPRLRVRGRKSQRSVARLPIAPTVESAKA